MKVCQEGEVVSVFLSLQHIDLGSQIDELRILGSILRIHSQEASLGEVFKLVLNLEE